MQRAELTGLICSFKKAAVTDGLGQTHGCCQETETHQRANCNLEVGSNAQIPHDENGVNSEQEIGGSAPGCRFMSEFILGC